MTSFIIGSNPILTTKVLFLSEKELTARNRRHLFKPINMKFEKALSLMREGKEVRHDGQTFFMDSKFIYKKVMPARLSIMIWSPKQSEVMSDKWEEVRTTVINEPNRWRP